MKTWVTAAMLGFVTAVETVSHWANRFDQGFLRTEDDYINDGVSCYMVTLVIKKLTMEMIMNMKLMDTMTMIKILKSDDDDYGGLQN